ncbi:MAG: hypothetical protein ACJAZ2_001593 [Glaciecola sp.]|jgi:hypothetical protein
MFGGMRILLIVLILLSILTLSCSDNTEVWKSSYQMMKSNDFESENHFEELTQYLILYSNGDAKLIDSLHNGISNSTLTNWEIIDREGVEHFSFGHGKESEGVLGVVLPITKKDENEFKMKFDSIAEGEQTLHIWNLEKSRHE